VGKGIAKCGSIVHEGKGTFNIQYTIPYSNEHDCMTDYIKDSFISSRFSIEGLECNFSDEMDLVYQEVQRSILSREELEAAQCEGDKYKAMYEDTNTKLINAVKEVHILQKA